MSQTLGPSKNQSRFVKAEGNLDFSEFLFNIDWSKLDISLIKQDVMQLFNYL